MKTLQAGDKAAYKYKDTTAIVDVVDPTKDLNGMILVSLRGHKFWTDHVYPVYIVRVLQDGTAREVNMVTNPKMGKRHINYESMLKTLPWENETISFLGGANTDSIWYALLSSDKFILLKPAE